MHIYLFSLSFVLHFDALRYRSATGTSVILHFGLLRYRSATGTSDILHFVLLRYRSATGTSSLSGCSFPMSECHGTASSACNVFLRDVATSRHSLNKFGFALDFRNVINGLTPSGWFIEVLLRWVLLIQKLGVKVGVKMEVKMDNTVDDQAFALFNFLFNSILFNSL